MALIPLEARSLLTSVTASSFEYETAHRNVFTFDGDVSSLFTKADLNVNNLSTNSNLDSTKYELNATGGNSFALAFPGYLYGAVPDGNYETTIEKEGIAGLGVDHALPFWFYNGDFNRSRKVDITDFAILASRFNTPGTFSNGDANYDGTTAINDFAIMAAKFNMSLNPPPTQPNTLSLSGLADTTTLNPFIRLNWSLPLDPPAGQPARLGFSIWRSIDGVNFGSTHYAQINDPNQTTFDDTAVTEGVHYWYRVRAFSDAGNSETTPKKDMITSLHAPINVTATALTQTQIQTAWTDQSTTENNFDIYRTLAGFTSFAKIGTISSSTSSSVGTSYSFVVDITASPGTMYRYHVVARNAAQD